jgi:hypothetical protein
MLARPSLLGSLILGLMFLLPGEGFAQSETKAPKKAKKEKKEKESEIGDYDGVRAGATTIRPPGARGKNRGKDRPVAYWVGFEPRDGGSTRVFVQLGTEVQAQQWIEGNSLVVHLPKIRIGNRTVSRFLDTRYFDTSIRTIRVKNAGPRRPNKAHPGHGRGLQIHFDFKNPADIGQASSSQQTEADGYRYLYLDFVAGTDLPESDSPESDLPESDSPEGD